MSRRAWLVTAVLAVAAGTLGSQCRPQPVPKTITARLRLAPSCGATAVSYNLGCLVAVETRATRVGGPSGGLGTRCTVPPPGNPQTLGDLLKTAGQELLNDIDLDQPLYLELRGYHGRNADGGAAEAVCQGAHVADWLFWGRSGAVSAAGGDTVAEVLLECRADCDCTRLGSVACPPAFPESACLPRRGCALPCASDAECFGSALRCTPGADGGRGTCTAREESLCTSCTSGNECSGGPCVVDVVTPQVLDGGALGGICGVSCPDRACPPGTQCVSLVSGKYRALP